MTQAVADTLRRAKALIDTLEKWAPNGFMLNNTQCSIQALNAASTINTAVRAADALRRQVSPLEISDWNDRSTHAEIMTAFDAAIATEESAP